MENTVFECPNCKLAIDLSFILGQEKIQPNPNTCHVCHRPYLSLGWFGEPKETYNYNERKPEITKEMLEQAKPKKEKILSGERKCCKICTQEKPVEDFYLVNRVSGPKKGQSYRLNRCEECLSKKRMLKYRQDEAHRNRIIARQKNLTPEQVKIKNARAKERRDKENLENPIYAKLKRAQKAQKPERRISRRIRNRLSEMVKGKKGISFSKHIGCSSKELRHYLESRFLIGMSWDNYGYGPGKWVIDHIKPLALFNKENQEELAAANHFSNLQPLWYEQNDAKDANYDPDHPMGWHGLNDLLASEDKEILAARLNYQF